MAELDFLKSDNMASSDNLNFLKTLLIQTYPTSYVMVCHKPFHKVLN